MDKGRALHGQEMAPPKPGCAQACPLALLSPGVKTGASGTLGDLSEYSALTLQAGLCRVELNISLASRGITNGTQKCKK